MKVIPASLVLKEYGHGPSSPAGGAARPRKAQPLASAAPAQEKNAAAENEKDIARKLERAFADGLRQGRAQAEEAFAEERQKLLAQHEQELSARESRWQQEAGKALAEGLKQGLEELATALGEQAAQVLAPVLAERARTRAVEQLGGEVRRLLDLDGALKIHVTGAPSLLSSLRDNLGELAPAVVFEEDAKECTLVAHLDETVLETRLSQWMRRIRESAPAAGDVP